MVPGAVASVTGCGCDRAAPEPRGTEINRGQIRTAVYERLGRPTTDTLLTSTEINDFINDALHHIATDYPWDWLETSENISTTTGVDTYAVAATSLATIEARIAGNPPLLRLSIGELDAMFPSTNSGSPVAYAIYGRSLIVRPIPITTVLPTIVHRFHRDEIDLSADGSSPIMPAGFHPAIAELATSLAFRRANNLNGAAAAAAQYAAWRNRMVEQVKRNQSVNLSRLTVDISQQPLPGMEKAASG